MNKIMFSFLPLVNSNFNFDVYRRSASGEKSEQEYRYNLPLSAEQADIRDYYFVSFRPREGNVLYSCNSHDNPYLTCKWLIYRLLEKTSITLHNNEYFVGTKFIPRISYIIERTEYGDRVVDTEPYFLKKTNEFGFTIDFRFSANAKGKHTMHEKKLSLSLSQDGQKNRNLYADKLRIISGFIASIISRLFPLDVVDISRQLRPLSCNVLEEKSYVFGGGNLGNNQFSGVMKYQPLSQPNKEPLYVFIFQNNRVNASRELWKALNGDTYTTFSGMKKMFGVNFANNRIKTIQVADFSESSLATIETQLDNFIEEYSSSQIVGIFAGIHKDFDASETYSPYYIVKNMFLRKGLAIQAVTIEQIQKRDGLKWSISGIGLQLFVKLGGTPWKVVPQNDNCLIFGISSAHLRDDKGNIRKYYAYSVCFDSSGLYKQLDILSESNSRETYLANLKNKITETLNSHMAVGITKCAIHVPFKIRKDEMGCIRECIANFKTINGEIEVVFIKINVENRFFGYSNINSKIPLSGSYVELSDTEFLVWFEGLQQGKENLVTAQSATNPVYIEFLDSKGLPPETVKAYLQDIINLSGANWRGYNAKHTPVSVYYPELIAKFIGKFDQYGLALELGIGAIDKAWFV